MTADALELLSERIDLADTPFTERGSRLVMRRGTAGLEVATAEYERPLAAEVVLRELTATRGDAPLRVVRARPDRVELGDGAALVFVDERTLALALPAGATGVAFVLPHAVPSLDAAGGLAPAGGSRRYGFAWTAVGGVLRQAVEETALGPRVRLEVSADRPASLLLAIGSPPRRAAPPVQAVLVAATDRWRAWFARVPPVRADLRPAYLHAWWVLAVNLLRVGAARPREGLVPSKDGYVALWNWDSYFHALALRHVDGELARDQIRIFLDHQLEDGMLPDVVHDDGILASAEDLPASDREKLSTHVGTAVAGEDQASPFEGRLTKPPLTAWAIWKLHELEPSVEFLAETYEALARSQRWWDTTDSNGDGLAEYGHPYSAGYDDSPIWDYGIPADVPDLHAYLVHQADRLADIAALLDRPRDEARWRAEAAQRLERLLRLRWRGVDAGFAAVRDGADVPVETPFHLMPLFTGRLPDEIAETVVGRLTDPARFWGERPLPTVSFADPAFDPQTMWRGPVWLNVNYLLVDGLRRSGHRDVADELRERSLALVAASGGLFEYWNPLDGSKPPSASTGFGMSAAAYVDLAIEASA